MDDEMQFEIDDDEANGSGVPTSSPSKSELESSASSHKLEGPIRNKKAFVKSSN